LKFLGYELPKFGADGLFGPETENSVKKFKSENNVEGSPIEMDTNFFTALKSKLQEKDFKVENIEKIYTDFIGDTLKFNFEDANANWIYWLSHNQGAYGASQLGKLASGEQTRFAPNIRNKFMTGWGSKEVNHIWGNVGSKGWDGEYKKQIGAAIEAGNDVLVARLFCDYQKKKFDQMMQNGLPLLNTKPQLKEIFAKYQNVFPIEFLAAISYQESKMNPEAGNNTYKGLFALNPDSSYGKKYGLTQQNVKDPEKNTEVAVKFWAENRKEFHNLTPQKVVTFLTGGQPVQNVKPGVGLPER